MGVYKRPEIEWKNGRAKWYYQFKYKKCRYYDGVFDTQKEAKAAEDKKRRELKSKRNAPLPNETVTFDQFMPKYLAFCKVTKAPRTADGENKRSRPIVKHFHNCRLTRINTGDIHEYIAKRKDHGLANRSINLELTHIRCFFKYAIQCNVARNNPAKDVTLLKVVRDEHWFPTEEEFKSFIEAAKKTPSATVLVPWLWFRAYTGTRPSESVFVEWQDIDFKNDQIWIRPKEGNELKNKKFRVIEMHHELKPILLEWKEAWTEIQAARKKRYPKSKDHDWVFFHPRKWSERAQGFHKSFYAAREKAGLSKMTSHTLRHYFISCCIMSEIDFFTIAKWVGHTNTRMIEEVYGHLSPEHRRKQMGKLSIVEGGEEVGEGMLLQINNSGSIKQPTATSERISLHMRTLRATKKATKILGIVRGSS